MKTKIRLGIYLLAAILFHLLFWQEGSGVNFVLFSGLITGIFFVETPKNFQSTLIVFSSSVLFVTSFSLLVHASFFAWVMFWFVLVVLVGFIFSKGRFTSNLFAFSLAFSNLVYFFVELIDAWKKANFVSLSFHQKLMKILRLSIWPVAFVVLFFLLYRGANIVFFKLTNSFFQKFAQHINGWFTDFSLASLLFGLFSFWIIGAIIFNGTQSESYCEPQSDLSRSQIKQSRSTSDLFSGLTRKLEGEKLSAVMMLLMLNLLTGVVNLIDLKWIWMDYSGATASQLSTFVHEGTYLLIFSVLLASGILLHFFRNNLNFFKKTKFLKKLAYLWIIQNMFMVLSVGVRNYYYIHEYGLAYKRLGVVFFLAIVFIGLLSLLYKIYSLKSFWYFVKFNAWSAFLILVFASWFNWDLQIAQYNINSAQNRSIDTQFLLSLSPKTIPYLEQNRDEIITRSSKYYKKNFDDRLLEKKRSFVENYAEKTWLSWSLYNAKAYQLYKDQFEQEKLTHTSP